MYAYSSWQNGMDIAVHHLKQRDLPAHVFPEGKRPTAELPPPEVVPQPAVAATAAPASIAGNIDSLRQDWDRCLARTCTWLQSIQVTSDPTPNLGFSRHHHLRRRRKHGCSGGSGQRGGRHGRCRQGSRVRREAAAQRGAGEQLFESPGGHILGFRVYGLI